MKHKTIFTFLIVFLLSTVLFGQSVLRLNPYDGTAGTELIAQIIADTTATGGLLADRVYELEGGGTYIATQTFYVEADQTLRWVSSSELKPVIYLFPTGTGTNPQRPPGNLIRTRGGDFEMTGIALSGYFEPVPDYIANLQGNVFRSDTEGSSFIFHNCVLSNINGQFLRTEGATVKIEVKDCIFTNMGYLGTSNLGAGKGIDLRATSCDSLIFVNNTFTNYQDRVIRHYNFGNPLEGTGDLNYALIDHNTFYSGMGFHGLLSLGNVGDEIIITNNLFVDAFASGEDPTDGTRTAEWANSGETYPNGNNRMSWIFTAQNETTNWKVNNNLYAISAEGQAFFDAHTTEPITEGSPLSMHIKSRLGSDSSAAFTKIEDPQFTNTQDLILNIMNFYVDPAGGNKTKETGNWVAAEDDMDRRPMSFWTDEFDVSYQTSSTAYTGAENGFPAGDLNAFPDKKAAWETYTPLAVVDGEKDAFYNTLTGPNDGYLQLRSFANSDNGAPDDDTDLSAKIWVGWDDVWLYLYEEVTDDQVSGDAVNVYENDEIELKFDPQPTDSAVNSIWDTRLTALGQGQGDVVSFDDLAPLAAGNKQIARKLTDNGYVLELAIKWSAIVSATGAETITPAVDNVFGLAINQHDNDETAGRVASLTWAAVMLDAVWNTPKYLGTVKFLPENKLQFIPTNNMTGVTNPTPYDGSNAPLIYVDGQKDAFFSALTGPDDGYLQLRSYANSDNGAPDNDADLSAKIWTAWDEDWFYLYEEVVDDMVSGDASNVWEEDEIEIKFDPQPTDSTVNSVWDTRLTALGEGQGDAVSFDDLAPLAAENKMFARKLTSNGYVLELGIRWTGIVSATGAETITPAVDNVFGMAINQHDNDETAGRVASLTWAAVMLDAVWNTPKYHGTVKFQADNKLQFIPTNNMTGLTNEIPYDGSDYVDVEDLSAIPSDYTISQNYPNPFNPATTITYGLPERASVKLIVFNMLGEKVATLVNEEMEAGYHQVNFGNADLSSGIYFYQLQTKNSAFTRKMMLLK
jgi:hypothetical protein